MMMTRTVLALGTFDGLHCGHMAVLRQALVRAKELHLQPTVLLFDRHPREVLTGVCPPLLMTEEDKRRRLASLGFSLEIVPFEALRSLSPAAFLDAVQKKLSPAVLCCGNNYRFGENAAGTVETLRALCSAHEIDVCAVPDALFDGAPVSSTRIRTVLEMGDVENANRMLGRPFSFALEVVDGDKRGHALGFPTLNQCFPAQLVRPKNGVYASKVFLNQMWYAAVTNIGVRPTIGTDRFGSETHVLGFDGDLYGNTVEVHLLKFLRPESDFGTLDALKAQIQCDANAAKDVFERTDHETKAACESRLL